jgi:uncharacterized membrane protein YsdA (DUF1294 family)
MKKIMCVVSLAFGLTVLSAGVNEAGAQTTKTKTVSSRKGKYALVGAGAGAATGAVVSKKKGKGAIIGGAAGAGAGYLLGRHKDKKNPKTKTVTKTKS